MLLVIALGLLSVVLVVLVSRPAPRPEPLRLVVADRFADRMRVSRAGPINQRGACAASRPTRDRSRW